MKSGIKFEFASAIPPCEAFVERGGCLLVFSSLFILQRAWDNPPFFSVFFHISKTQETEKGN